MPLTDWPSNNGQLVSNLPSCYQTLLVAMGVLDFTQWEAISFASIHTELPVICLSLYFAFLHVVPEYIRPGKGYSKELKIPFALWNLGPIDVIPALYRAVTQEGKLISTSKRTALSQKRVGNKHQQFFGFFLDKFFHKFLSQTSLIN